MAMWIGVGIWLAVMLVWGLSALRRRARLKRNPPATTAQQVWDEATPEEQAEASRGLGWNSAWSVGGGAGPGGSSPGC